VKKCASCSKDLPDAALHCVFCGAKQAAAPAVQPSVAKTAFGYSANEVMQQLGRPATAPQQPTSGLAGPSHADAATVLVRTAPQPHQPPQPAPYQPPQPAPYQPPQPAPYQPPQPAPYQPPQPAASAGAFAPYGGPPPGGGMGIHSPPQPTPAPLPAVQSPPYLASQTASRAGRPIEPWKDSLKLWMIVWGALALVAFAIPLMLDPMVFNWDAIIHEPGKGKIAPLCWAAIALLSIVVAMIPLESAGRGFIALALGLAGIVTPIVLAEHHAWQSLAQSAGLVLLVPGLLLRDEYVESLLARIMVTLGVLAYLAPFLVPDHGQIPLVMMFKGLIEVDGKEKVLFILAVAHLVLVVLCLLVWMPGPATGGAKIFAWLVILAPVVDFAVSAALRNNIGAIATNAPGQLAVWVPGVTYSVLAGYGLATVLGKQLE